MSTPNEAQIVHWNRDAGPTWVRYQELLDVQIAAHGELALEALAPAPGERILDVGCGCGSTSLELARRVGPRGEVLGIDLSEPMLARAEERAGEAGLGHVRFRRADAQTEAFPEAHFDAAFSRFGVMFFDDPGAAFANLHRALRPGGRLAFVCWQGPERNPWITVPMGAVAPLVEMPPPLPPGSPGIFGLADAERVRAVLTGAGFEDVAVRGERVVMRPGGGDVARAADTFLEVGPVAGLLREQGADEALRARVRDAVRAALEAARGEDGLHLDSGVWVVTARRSG